MVDSAASDDSQFTTASPDALSKGGIDNAASDDSQITTASPDAFSKGGIDKRPAWHNWHVHDGQLYLNPDPTGLSHKGTGPFPEIFNNLTEAEYIATASLHVYCPDGVDKGLVGGDGGSKIASGTCQNEDSLIHLQKNDNPDAPAPAGWKKATFNGIWYRVTAR